MTYLGEYILSTNTSLVWVSFISLLTVPHPSPFTPQREIIHIVHQYFLLFKDVYKTSYYTYIIMTWHDNFWRLSFKYNKQKMLKFLGVNYLDNGCRCTPVRFNNRIFRICLLKIIISYIRFCWRIKKKVDLLTLLPSVKMVTGNFVINTSLNPNI